MTHGLDLNYDFPDDDGERLALTTRVWSEPVIPRLRDRPPRLTNAAGWTPFRSHILARTVSPVTGEYDAVLGGGRPGTVLDFHLGCASEQPLPETRRLVKHDGHYITLAEYEPIGRGMTSLGFIGTVPFPMLDALEVRRTDDGQHVLAAGDADPVRTTSEPVGTLGFVEPFPLRPRRPPGAMGRGMRPLLRWFDRDVQAHAYGSPEDRPDGAVCLGSVRVDDPAIAAHNGLGYVPVIPSRLARGMPSGRMLQRVRWTVAPLTWNGVGRQPRLAGTVQRARLSGPVAAFPAGDDLLVGYIRDRPAPHHSPLYAAVHPVTGDLFLSRSALEAGDLGYRHVQRLGWIVDSGADRRAGSDRIWWASRFGQVRRYDESSGRSDADPPHVAGSIPPTEQRSTVLLEARAAPGLACFDMRPGETRTVVDSGAARALVVAVNNTESGLLAVTADSHARCARRVGADYVVVSITGDDVEERLADATHAYDEICRVEPDDLLGSRADPFRVAETGVVRGDRSLPFAERRRRLLQFARDASTGDDASPSRC